MLSKKGSSSSPYIASYSNQARMTEVYSKVTDKLAHGVADVLGAHRPKYSKWGFELLKKDPVLEFFRAWGFKVVEYDLDPYPLRLAAIIAVRMGAMIVGE